MEPQAPRSGTIPSRAGDYGLLSYRMVQHLRGTRPWVRFLAAYGFVVSALLLLGAFALMVYVVVTPGPLEWLVGVAVALALISVVTLAWAFPLHRYASSIGRVQAGDRERAVEEALAFQKSFWQIAGILTLTWLVLLIGLLLLAGVSTFRRGAGRATAILPWRGGEPSARPAPGEVSSPGVTLGLDDLGRACGDLREGTFLCLVNQGSDRAAGGARDVVTRAHATFHSQADYGNAISITVEGKPRYRIEFGPPKGKALLPGLYTGAERWPFNSGAAPGLDITVGSSGCNESEGQFRILEIELSDGHIRRFVADFESGCKGPSQARTIGRIAVADDTPGPSSPTAPSEPAPGGSRSVASFRKPPAGGEGAAPALSAALL